MSRYIDSLSKDEKENLKTRLYEMQNHRCFICQEEIIDPLNQTHVDHIKPLVNGGQDNEQNFGLTHGICNEKKLDSDMYIARVLYRLEKIKENAKDSLEPGESPSLKHVLEYLNGSLYSLQFRIDENDFIYSYSEMGNTVMQRTKIFVDRLSNEKSVILEIPIEYLHYDREINPRGINSSISKLIKEFYKSNPQLHLILARLDNGKVKIFDGQHKAVAQLMLGTRTLLIRLFICPNLERLRETNTNAGKELCQISFDKAIVRQLHDVIYKERINKYQKDLGKDENDFSFSEKDLVNHFKAERRDIKKYITDSQKNQIVHSNENNLCAYINFEGKGNELPLSYSTFEKTFLSRFVDSKLVLETTLDYKIEEGLNPRKLEIDQLIKLCNMIADIFLIGKYNNEIGNNRIENSIVKGEDTQISDDHLIACRVFREEIMQNLVIYIENIIKHYYAFNAILVEEGKLFQQKIDEQLWERIYCFLQNFRALPCWINRQLASTIFGGKNNRAYWHTIFTTGNTIEGTPILLSPLDVLQMIHKNV